MKKRESFSGHLRFEVPTLLIADIEMLSTSSTHSIKESMCNIKPRFEKYQINIRMPTPLFITSITASVAFCTSGNCTTAMVVGSTGANRMVAYTYSRLAKLSWSEF